MEWFGPANPKEIQPHFFFGVKSMDYAGAEKADISRQNFCAMPRTWYIPAIFECRECGIDFNWTVPDQRRQFEVLGFYVDALPSRCPSCRKRTGERKALMKEYDSLVRGVKSGKKYERTAELLEIIGRLKLLVKKIPARMADTETLLIARLKKAETECDRRDGPPASES